MKNLLLLFLFISNLSVGQNYFQQEVNYTIQVSLDDKNLILHAYEEFEYVNNSPDELSFIYIHLWPNAYADNKSAMAKQHYRDGNKIMEDLPEIDKGFIDSLDFKVNGNKVEFLYNLSHKDIGKLMLKSPLKPGEKITVSTPFRVKIPSGKISRLGHVGESFQITQWYPKPAVYDKEGWHQMPYLTQGEFYSEFGSFDVSITLPENYVVGATGDLQTQSEIQFLNKKAEETQVKIDSGKFERNKFKDFRFPESSSKMKTIRYTQTRVHDFGWFADKRYEVLKGEVELPYSKRKVTTWAMFTQTQANLWINSIEYLNDATFWYSKWNGDYPYNQVTAVDGTISAGGGMEYPNVTVIGSSGSAIGLETVIVHEVGHNWFYGILGSNERVHPWMDEGINTANEIRYMETKYPNNAHFSDNFGGVANTIHLGGISHHCGNDMTYQVTAGNGKDQPIELHSNEYTPLNYGAIVYAKTGLSFSYLRDYLGEKLYDKCMSNYFENWKFKHPQPADIKAVFEKGTGKDLSWFFDDLVNTTKQIDYKIISVKKNIMGSRTASLGNKGKIVAPVRVDAFVKGELVETVWTSGDKFEDIEAVFKTKDIDKVVIDSDKKMPESNRSNNTWEKSRILNKTEPIKFEFLFGDNERDKNTIWWTPMIGANAYDNFMLGAVFHNISIPKNKFEFMIAPLYSFGGNRLSGLADAHFNFVPNKIFKRIELGAKWQSFMEEPNGINSTYYSTKPYLYLEIGNKGKRTDYKQHIELQGAINQSYNKEIDYLNEHHLGGIFDYHFEFKKRIYKLEADYRIDYLREKEGLYENSNTSITLKNTFIYKVKKEKKIEVRLFAGINLLRNSQIYSYPTPDAYSGYGPFTYIDENRFNFNLGGQSGTQDYFYEQLMFGRNETNGMYGQQRIENQGGFKTVSGFGNSKVMVSGNLFAELPYIPLLGVFADYGVFDNGNKLITAADLGLGIRLGDGLFSIYAPILETDNIKNSLKGVDYIHKIRFSINIKAYNYRKILSLF